ncbi:hypothetical protein LTR29_010287 [Friedmanniomyces endolithicus]|nr:hypothetical protein LTR29_010287 [Friedmanniomyces endolithicus]
MAPKAKRDAPELDVNDLPTPALDNADLRMSYRIARGEQGVLTFEPYKSLLLPHWRFRTIPIAQASSTTLWRAFQHYVETGDFVGADMARKFIQMGMTRAKRYANHKGGRKYDRSAREEEKLGASEVFREVWRRCGGDERYLDLKREFLAEQKVWDGERKKAVKKEEEEEEEMKVVKDEEVDDG